MTNVTLPEARKLKVHFPVKHGGFSRVETTSPAKHLTPRGDIWA